MLNLKKNHQLMIIKMANLFEISEKYLRLQEQLEENGGEITEELAGQLDIAQTELEEKIKAYYHIIKLQEAQVDLSKEEKERLNGRQKAKENSIKRMKDAIATAIDMFGIIPHKKKSKSLTFTNLSVWLKETESFQITDETKIPDKYKTCSIEVNVTKKADVIKVLEDANIYFTFSPIVSINKTAVKIQYELEKELSDVERQERIDNGEKLIEGVVINANRTPVFN